MIKIYTDASFYENYNQTDIVGGVGITAIFYDNYGEKIKEEYYAFRYTKEDIMNHMYWRIPNKCLSNSIMEFFAVLEAFDTLKIDNGEVRLYCDWDEIERLINREHECSYMLRREPNLKYMLNKFKRTYYQNNLIYVTHVKGHNKLKYNCYADFLSKYWLNAKLAIETILNNPTSESLHEAKMNIFFRERRIRKERRSVVN